MHVQCTTASLEMNSDRRNELREQIHGLVETRGTIATQSAKFERHHGVTIRCSSGFALFIVVVEGRFEKDFLSDAGFIDSDSLPTTTPAPEIGVRNKLIPEWEGDLPL